MVSLSINNPTNPEEISVHKTATKKGSLSDSEKNHIKSPPITTNSPWARFMIEVELYIILKPIPTSA